MREKLLAQEAKKMDPKVWSSSTCKHHNFFFYQDDILYGKASEFPLDLESAFHKCLSLDIGGLVWLNSGGVMIFHKRIFLPPWDKVQMSLGPISVSVVVQWSLNITLLLLNGSWYRDGTVCDFSHLPLVRLLLLTKADMWQDAFLVIFSSASMLYSPCSDKPVDKLKTKQHLSWP